MNKERILKYKKHIIIGIIAIGILIPSIYYIAKWMDDEALWQKTKNRIFVYHDFNDTDCVSIDFYGKAGESVKIWYGEGSGSYDRELALQIVYVGTGTIVMMGQYGATKTLTLEIRQTGRYRAAFCNAKGFGVVKITIQTT